MNSILLRRIAWSLAAMGGAAFAVAACSANRGSTEPDPPEMDGCTALAKAMSAGMVECGNEDAIILTFGDVATFEADAVLMCKKGQALAGSAATEENLQACATLHRTAGCKVVNDPHYDLQSGPCAFLDQGTLRADAPCFRHEQCESGNCRRAHRDGCGTCSALVPASTACDRSKHDICAHGTRCTGDVCTPTIAKGQPCGPDDACDTGYGCLDGQCVDARLAEGAPCDPNRILCAQGLICDRAKAGTDGGAADSAKWKCRRPAPLSFSRTGGVCGVDGNLVKTCVGGNWCDQQGTSFTGTCRPLLKVGEECTITEDSYGTPSDRCFRPAHCRGGKCTVDEPVCN